MPNLFQNVLVLKNPQLDPIKLRIVLSWKAPDDFVGNIVFRATAAKSREMFWGGILSPVLGVVSNEA